MPRPISRRVALRAAQFAIGAAGIFFLMLLFSKSADAATAGQDPSAPGLTSAVSAVTSVVPGATSAVTGATSVLSGAPSVASGAGYRGAPAPPAGTDATAAQ